MRHTLSGATALATGFALLLATHVGAAAASTRVHAAAATKASANASTKDALNNCVYENDQVSLSGELHRKRASAEHDADLGGPASGKHDSIVMLRLRRPLCVMLPDDVGSQLRPRRVHEVQLLSQERLPRSSSELRHVQGTVLLDAAGSHDVPVQVSVERIQGRGDKALQKRR